MSHICLILVSLIVAGCSWLPAKKSPPIISSVPIVEVPVPIIEKCISAGDVPKIPPSRMPSTGNIEQLAAGTSLSYRELIDYAKRAAALLQSCAEEN